MSLVPDDALKLSTSKISAMTGCPIEYYAKYGPPGLRPPPNPTMARGLILHETLEARLKGERVDQAFINGLFAKYQLFDPRLSVFVRDELDSYVEKIKRLGPYKVEDSFCVKVEGVWFHGAIDVLLENEIRDHKLVKSIHPQGSRAKSTQHVLYALATGVRTFTYEDWVVPLTNKGTVRYQEDTYDITDSEIDRFISLIPVFKREHERLVTQSGPVLETFKCGGQWCDLCQHVAPDIAYNVGELYAID